LALPEVFAECILSLSPKSLSIKIIEIQFFIVSIGMDPASWVNEHIFSNHGFVWLGYFDPGELLYKLGHS